MISEQADEDAIIIWGAALDDEMEDTISVIVIATGFPTTDHFDPVPTIKKEEKKPVSPFQYNSPMQRQEVSRFGTVSSRPQERPVRPQQPQYQAPQYQAPQYQQPVYNQHPVQSAPQAPVYPNANTKSSANPSPRGSSQSRNSSDSDDSFVDIISIFNNK